MGSPVHPNCEAQEQAIRANDLRGVCAAAGNALEHCSGAVETPAICKTLRAHGAVTAQMTGSGAAVFANLQLRAVPDDELERYDRVYYGVDWGWYPDPWAYNAASYDAARRGLVIFDELTRNRTPNRETAQLLVERGLTDPDSGTLTADAAEPKSCADYRAAGLPCRAAQKGPGSVRQSMKWLQGLAAIVIDPVRCPATAAEFSEYEYDRDPRTGEVLAGYPDVNNHHIDAVRYAVEGVWRRRGA